MSNDDKDDDITVVASHSGEYASSEPGSSPQRIKTGKPRLTKQNIYSLMLYNIIMLIL